jgi:hypothetical protein
MSKEKMTSILILNHYTEYNLLFQSFICSESLKKRIFLDSCFKGKIENAFLQLNLDKHGK